MFEKFHSQPDPATVIKAISLPAQLLHSLGQNPEVCQGQSLFSICSRTFTENPDAHCDRLLQLLDGLYPNTVAFLDVEFCMKENQILQAGIYLFDMDTAQHHHIYYCVYEVDNFIAHMQ
jgi:hypothetical protein